MTEEPDVNLAMKEIFSYMDRNDVFDRAKNLGGRGFHSALGTLGDFRTFILRGNVVDLAVGVVIGAAFTAVVSTIVSGVLQPLIGVFIAQFSTIQDLTKITSQVGEQKFQWGAVITAIITFLLTALVVYFAVVKPVNALEAYYSRLRPKKQEAPTTRECPFCISTVNRKATRCAFCTAQLPPIEDAAVESVS